METTPSEIYERLVSPVSAPCHQRRQRRGARRFEGIEPETSLVLETCEVEAAKFLDILKRYSHDGKDRLGQVALEIIKNYEKGANAMEMTPQLSMHECRILEYVLTRFVEIETDPNRKAQIKKLHAKFRDSNITAESMDWDDEKLEEESPKL